MESVLRFLPPLQIGAANTFRPTLVIGAGGTAGLVLGNLQQRICEQWKKELPAFRMLLLDSDPRSLVSAPAGENVDLPSGSKMLVGLQRLEKYHEKMPQLLQWIDRRWIYDIPRSGQPNGLRPLGRLAFVDHAEEIHARIHAILSQLIAPDSLEITAQLTGWSVECADPLIYLVSSLSGGTGGGMIFDLAYAARKVLAEMGLTGAELRGILTFSSPRRRMKKTGSRQCPCGIARVAILFRPSLRRTVRRA